MVNQQRGYLVAYDVSDDYRRSHIAKILQHYGERLQYSVFLLRVRPSMMLDVRMQVEQELMVQLIPLCSVLWGRLHRRKRDWISWDIVGIRI